MPEDAAVALARVFGLTEAATRRRAVERGRRSSERGFSRFPEGQISQERPAKRETTLRMSVAAPCRKMKHSLHAKGGSLLARRLETPSSHVRQPRSEFGDER